MMRTVCGISLWIVVLAALAAGQSGSTTTAAADQYLGTWTGTWDGAGTGGFEITLERGSNGALGGSVSVTGEPTYSATLKTAAMDGSKLTARYDFPPDERAEVVLVATFDKDSAKGTWAALEKATGSEAASGTWTVKRK
jgi:hypothetical protein